MHKMPGHEVHELCAVSGLCHMTDSEVPIPGSNQKNIKKLSIKELGESFYHGVRLFRNSVVFFLIIRSYTFYLHLA